MHQGNLRFQARNVAWQPGSFEAATDIFGTPERADDALAWVQFALARSPVTAATTIVMPGPPVTLYCIKTERTGFWPGVAVFYTYDPTHVYIEAVIRASYPLD